MFSHVDRCWVCLAPLNSGISCPVQLHEDLTLPCCMNCWTEVPQDRRLELARQYAELLLGQQQRKAAIDALYAIGDLFREAIQDFRARMDDERWKRHDDDGG